MSFDRLSNLVNGATQGYFGESVFYIRDETETPLKALFDTQWVEINGVSTKALTCEVLAEDLPSEPRSGDKVRRGSKTYAIHPPRGSSDEKVLTLILKD